MFVPLASSVMVLGLVGPSPDGGARRLNAPLPRAPGGDVVEARHTQDGSRLVFRSDRERDEVFELYSVPAAGSAAPVKLNGPLAPGEIVRSGFQVIPGGRVLFEVGPNDFSNGRLFSAPANGSSAAVELAGAAPSLVHVSFDGAFLVSRQSTDLVAQPADGSAPVFPLDSSAGFVGAIDVSPNANRAVYNSFGSTSDLFVVDIAPGAVPIQLTPPFANGSGVSQYTGSAFLISPDGATVVYRADQRAEGDFELFGVPIGGGTSVLLSGSLAAGSGLDVLDFAIDPTSSRVLFVVGPAPPFNPLHSAPLDGSGSPVQLYWNVADWRIDPTGQRAVFRNSAYHPFIPRSDLHSVPIDGSSASEGIGFGAVGGFQINAQGTRVAFSSFDGYSTTSLLSAPISSGSGPAAVVLPTSARGAPDDFRFSQDGATIVYRTDLDVPGTVELYSAPASTGVPVKLNDPLPAGGHVESLVSPSDGSVSFVADLELPSVFEAFSVPVGGGVNTRQSGSMPFNNLLGTVSAFRTSNRRAVYIAHPGDPDHAQLFGVSFKGGAHALNIGGSQLVDPERLELAPDGERVLYLATNTSQTGDVELYSAVTDASSPPVRLAPDMVADGAALPFRLYQDGEVVAFISDRRSDDQRELYAGPSDGSFPAVRLSGALPAGGDVIDFAVSPEAGAAVYLADQVTDEVFELFSRSIPGAPVRLNGPLTAFGDVTSFQVSPDGTFVVYRADETSNDVFELFRAPIDGGSASVRLNSALVSGGDVVSYQVSPDGTRVVYLADQLLNGRNELFSAPSDASSSPVRLNDQLPQYGDGVLDGYLLRAGVVVFKATIPPGVIGLFAALVDGSAPATALASPAAPIGDIWSFQLTADGTRALFISGPGSWVNLHGVPTDGSSDPYRIDVGPTSGKVYALGISADGEHVAYLEAADGHDVRELVLARSDGSATPHRINRPLGRLGDVSPDFRFTADGTHLLFRAEDQDPDAFELFVRTIDGRIAGAADPDE